MPAIVEALSSPACADRGTMAHMQTIPDARLWHPQGWHDGVKLDVDDHGRITRSRRAAPPRAGSCPASPTCIRMPSSAPWPAWPSARPTPPTRSGPGARPCTASPRISRPKRCMPSPRSSTRDAGSRLHHGLRVPLPAPRARRHALRRSGGDVARADRSRARNRHPPDPAAGAVHDRWFRRTRAVASASAASATTSTPYLRLLDALREDAGTVLHIGCALHSLRAVPADAMRAVLDALPPAMPVHIHIAEQIGEVDDCLAVRKARARSNGCSTTRRSTRAGRWCMPRTSSDAEVQGIARSGATVAICPTTEANLGDGLFPLRDYLDAGGALGHRFGLAHLGIAGRGTALARIRPAPASRATATSPCGGLAERRRDAAARRGDQRRGLDRSRHRSLADGEFADALVLDTDAPQLAGVTAEDAIDRWIFSGNRNLVRDVCVGGRLCGRSTAGTCTAMRSPPAIARDHAAACRLTPRRLHRRQLMRRTGRHRQASAPSSVQQEPLGRQAAAEAGQAAVAANHAMAGQHDRQRIATVGGADRTHGRGPPTRAASCA